jgi:hypothetical protein
MDDLLNTLGFERRPVGRLSLLENKRRPACLCVSDNVGGQRLVTYTGGGSRFVGYLNETEARKRILRFAARVRGGSPA